MFTQKVKIVIRLDLILGNSDFFKKTGPLKIIIKKKRSEKHCKYPK